MKIWIFIFFFLIKDKTKEKERGIRIVNEKCQMWFSITGWMDCICLLKVNKACMHAIYWNIGTEAGTHTRTHVSTKRFRSLFICRNKSIETLAKFSCNHIIPLSACHHHSISHHSVFVIFAKWRTSNNKSHTTHICCVIDIDCIIPDHSQMLSWDQAIWAI